MYAHIFKARKNAAGHKVELILTAGPGIAAGILSTATYLDKRAAKAAAKVAGAAPHNY